MSARAASRVNSNLKKVTKCLNTKKTKKGKNLVQIP